MTEEFEPEWMIGPTDADGSALAPAAAAGAGELATPEDVAAFQDAFLRLLERRTAIYTQGDSTSVPTHVAADLLCSVCFVLGIDPEARVIPEHLLHADLEREYARGIEGIGAKVAAAEQLWRDVLATMPLIPNIALRDSLAEIGEFFKRYDYRSMAHDIPCMIDYPLAHPVPDELLGIDWIAEYLRPLMIEAEFLAKFDVDRVQRVLAATCPDPVEQLINLYEPVATNAIGLALIGEDARGLVIGDAEQERIAAKLAEAGEPARGQALRGAAGRTCEALELADAAAREYLGTVANELLPRVTIGLERSDLRGVFVG